ncbi:MAG: hypothetical protein VB111_01920 [Clostridiaceae bacterium]|nr:hypothetical protein [Clostridiaceae bacterium]
MRFAVGYQLAENGEEPFSHIVSDYRDHIAELYFPWLDTPTCRSALATRNGHTDWTAQGRLEEELRTVHRMGVKLDLLLNANCYGGEAVSKALTNRVCSIAEHLENAVGGLEIVTTTSPFIAHVLKEHFPHIERRASVNMRIGEVKGMEYLVDLFDSFYIRREYNRDFDRIRELKTWVDANGKQLLMLANSGCMNYCSGQTFHDNLVSHEAQISETINQPGFPVHTCWRYLRDSAHRVSVLQNSWVRPEDLHHYEGLFDVVKLATRMHSLPGMVIDAYVRGRYYGNLLDLCEPGFGPAFAPYVIDNAAFPEDFFDRVVSCDKRCHACGYCQSVLERVMVRAE